MAASNFRAGIALAMALVLFSGHSTPAFAYELNFGLEGASGKRGQAEFFNTNPEQRVMIKLNLVAGVGIPGIYHVPDNTNLLEAISLAGGGASNADLSEVYVRRETPDGTKTFEYNLDSVMKNPKTPFPKLENFDTIYVKQDNSQQAWMSRLTLVSLVLGILSTSALVVNAVKE